MPQTGGSRIGIVIYLLATAGLVGVVAARCANGEQEIEKRVLQEIEAELVPVPAGSFMTGPEGGPAQRVEIGRAFSIGRYEVTQGQFEAVMGKNPSAFKGNARLPVHQVLWADALEFCRRLSQSTGDVYRLPTEAEWEYARRAGTTTAFYWGDSAAEAHRYANYADVSCRRMHQGLPESGSGGDDGFADFSPVGSFPPNPWGLFDMCGNVSEWCANGKGPETTDGRDGTGTVFVARGGNGFDVVDYLRSSNDFGGGRPGPSVIHLCSGFRVVREER